jgi:uncharacterized metal-binding protein YceD (DUF177 family)
MSDPLRDRQSLKVLAVSRQVIEIAHEFGSFQRLAASVEQDFTGPGDAALPTDWRKSPVCGELRFAPAGGSGDAGLSGHVEAHVPAVCQRCLDAFEWRLASDVDLRVTVSGDGTGISGDGSGREVWELAGDTLRPIDLVDELLVMALPLSAMHEDTAGCAARVPRPAGVVEKEMTRPFASLRTQMDDANE